MKEKLAAAIVLFSLLATTAAVFWYRAAREPAGWQPGDRVITLTGYAACGVWTTDEINGLNYWWKEFEPATLNLEQGESIVLRLVSADVLHRFYCPGLDIGPIDVKPGHIAEVRFTAPEAGLFQYYCTANCGCCHFYMRGWVVVTAPDAAPVDPPDIVCPLCLPDFGPPPQDADLVDAGRYVYLAKGCSTCHGPEGRGGVVNDNYTSDFVPAHNRTAEKFFLEDDYEAETFIEMLAAHPGLVEVDEDLEDEFTSYLLVDKRYHMAREIMAGGKYSAKKDPDGPEPPLQMPAWKYILSEKDMDSLLAYFVSLQPWDDEEFDADEEYDQ